MFRYAAQFPCNLEQMDTYEPAETNYKKLGNPKHSVVSNMHRSIHAFLFIKS